MSGCPRRDERANIRDLPLVENEDLQRLQYLINEAINSLDPCSCFLLLYQIIEYLLSHVFEIAVKVFCHDENLSKNPWDLRVKINEATNELWRLDRIINDFLSQSVEPEISAALLEECSRFLTENRLTLTRDIPNSVAKGIYAVRNVLIHRQIEMMASVREQVFNINVLFLAFVLELLIKFDKIGGEAKLQERLLN